MTPRKPKYCNPEHERRLCECGSRATRKRSTAYICDRCASMQTQKAFAALHQPTCGVPDVGGLAVHSLDFSLSSY